MCSCSLRTPKKNHASRFEPLAAIAFAMLSMGVTPTPPAISTTGLLRAMSKKKCPVGALTFRMSPSLIVSEKKLEAAPGGSSGRSAGAFSFLIVTR